MFNLGKETQNFLQVICDRLKGNTDFVMSQFFMFTPKIVLIVLLVGLGVGGLTPYLSCNYEPATVNEYVFVSGPLEVPLSLPRSSDPRPPTPIHQKYNLRHHTPREPNLDIPGLKPRMVHNDFVLVYEFDPPSSFFEEKHPEDYHLLESLQFVVVLSNPSEIFTICLNEIFSDSESITKALRRPLPLCINPYTKYPLHFNLYVTAVKNRQLIKSAIFFNATIMYEGNTILNRIWMKQVKFNLLPNHLKLYSLQLRNCKQDSSIVSIKNPEKQELTLLIQYKYKKFYMNNQPFDDKVTIGSSKMFKFLIEGRDATMTIYTYSQDAPNRIYPPLYVPLYCLEPLIIQYVPIGIISAPNLALTYPIFVTSHSSHAFHIEHISLQSTSQTVQLLTLPTHKIVIQPNEKMARVGSFIVRSAQNPSPRNTIIIQIHYQQQNSSTMARIKRELFYSELIDIVDFGSNRFYDLSKVDSDFNESEKIEHYKYPIINKMQIPIRIERIVFNSQQFRMHWFGYTGTYVYPGKIKEEFMLEYIGKKEIPLSPYKFAAVMELSGGITIPFETMVYDNTLYCKHQGRESRCNKIKYINFGYQKTEQNMQVQVLTIANLNPTNISMTMQPYSLPALRNIKLSVLVGKPFPFYTGAIDQNGNAAIIHLRSGHLINITFQVHVNETVIADMMLDISTPFEQIKPHLKFQFETGKLLFSPETIIIPYSDRIHRGYLNLSSSYQQNYTIKQVISQASSLLFEFNEEQQYGHHQNALIPFTYNPFYQHNFTQDCCGEDYIRNKYLNYLIKVEEQSPETYEVTLVTSSDVEAKTKIEVESRRASLLDYYDSIISVNALKVRFGGTFCIQVNNPYEGPLKYSVALIPSIIVDKPKDYFTYLKYAKREKVDTYFCMKNDAKNLHHITSSNIKELFRLEDNPKELLLKKEGSISDKNQLQKTNLSTNDYLNSFRSNGKEICFKFSGILYFKLLIESDLLNDILEQYPYQYAKRLINLEHDYISESTFTALYDQFYAVTPINFQKYCQSAVYPIFRFCQHLPLKSLMPNFNYQNSKRQKRYRHNTSRIIAPKAKEQVCFLISGFHSSQTMSFHLLIANNHSKFDDYSVTVNLVEPKIQVGDVSFEETHNINHDTFIKHYFSSLYQAISKQPYDQSLAQNGITHKSKIIPVYFTSDDYSEHFRVFKGSRYFQLVNHAPIDVEFTHYGFGHLQNVRFHEGFSIEQVGRPAGSLKIAGKGKSTFKIDFRVDHSFHINYSNPYFHHSLTLYFYKGSHYHIQLHLLIKIADNIATKIQAKEQESQYQENRPIGYILLNFLSFSYICLVIWQLKQEEDAKKHRLRMFQEKQDKISGLNNKQNQFHLGQASQNDLAEEKMRRNRYILPAQSIGKRFSSDPDVKFKLCTFISEEDLAFFKSTLLAREERSIISESSESQPPTRLSHEEEKLKTDEESKSQKSFSLEKSEIEEPRVESSSLNESQADHFQEEDVSSELEGSEHSLTESFLPDGISVCNEEIDLDENIGFEFDFEKQKTSKKNEKKNSNQEYKWFQSENPLKKEKDPFPWMAINEKKKNRYAPKHRKIQ